MRFLKSLSDKIAYKKQRSHRIEELADGVFAIVMTLLVLDIRVPVREISTEYDVWSSLQHAAPRILTFILSFSVAGQFWSIFINHFNYTHSSDRSENIIALFFLLSVSLLPYSTSFLSEHLWSKVATGFYIFNIVLILSFNTLHWYYAYHNGLVQMDEQEGEEINKAIMNRACIAFMAYGVMVLCCFYSSYLALCGTILVHIVLTFSGFIQMINAALIKKIKYRAQTSSNDLSQALTEPAAETISETLGSPLQMEVEAQLK